MHPTHPLAKLTRAPKVHNLDGTSLGVTQQYVLRLQVAVDDAELRRSQEEQCCAHLLGELAGQVERDAAEVGVPQQVIQVVGQHLKHQTEVVSKHEVALQVD